jgi:hypothetical protein
MPNSIANLVFFSWPIIVFWLLVKYPAKYAIFTAITLAVLLLPSNFIVDLPLLPALTRETITSLTIVCTLLLLGKKFRFFQSGLIVKVIVGYIIIIIISAELNGAPEIIGSKFLPGLSDYDAFSNVIRALLWLIPFFLGRYFFTEVKDNEAIIKIIVIIGLIYSIPMLYEIRFSPQLHRIVYGYHASDFLQNMREGGFRPTVFVGGGLTLAFWFSTCLISAMALHKNKIPIGKLSPQMIVCFLAFVLVLSKTWSAFIYVAIGVIFIYRLSPSRQVKLSFLMATLILFYPVSKIMGIFPDRAIISTIAEYNTERAESMEVRYVNEEILLTHALKKPFFGWGGWGRNRLYDNSGKDTVITDGQWIIVFGVFGAFGFVFYYLILIIPLYYAVKNMKLVSDTKDQTYFAVLAIILAVSIVDSVPNSNMGPMHLLLAGALLGQAEFIKKQRVLLTNEKPILNYK